MNKKPARYMSYSPASGHLQGVRTRKRDSVSGSETDISTSNENLSNEDRYVMRHTHRQDPQGQENVAYNTLIIRDDNWRYADVPPPAYRPKSNHPNTKETVYDPSIREITDIPDDYLRQSQVLKHLAKEVKVCSSAESSGESENPPGSHGTGHKNSDNSCGGGSGGGKQVMSRRMRSKLSKSQPDLTNISTVDVARDQQRCNQMLDHLIRENNSLKSELEACYHRVSKSHKLEEEVSKVTRAHEELVATCERRERLESARIARLQQEVRRLQDANQRLIAQHLLSTGGMDKCEAWVAQLVTQNKELLTTKERQEIELASQRATLQEQRTHIDILDTALINAQANVVRLEEECRQKQVHVERVGQLQRALSSLQLASDRREQTERKLRLQLEEELQAERARHSNRQDAQADGENMAELKKQLREKDEKIMWLEGEVAKWERKYLEESQQRQAAIDAASIPKDAKIAALERTSQETEKLIAEARSDRIKQMDEVHAAQKKVTDLEARVKELECKLAEKDAMIRVLQKKHTLDKEVSSSYPSISLDNVPNLNTNVLGGDNLGGGVSTTSVFSTVSSALTSSTGFSSGASYSGSVNSYHHKYSSPAESYHHRSLEGRLKELDTQLMGKGLVGGSGGGSSGGGSASGSGSGARQQEDIALLEKQGLCSQQTRSASLPPSSLPRPKRSGKSSRGGGGGSSGGGGVEKKCGEYGRLDSGRSAGRSGSESPPVRIVKLSNSGSGGGSISCDAPPYSRLSNSGDSTPPPGGSVTPTSSSTIVHRPPYQNPSAVSKMPAIQRSSFLPPPRKITDYPACFTQQQQLGRTAPSLVRRSSLPKPAPSSPSSSSSLPIPNKYRIQF